MPGRSEDKLFWCIVASIVLMFIKEGAIIIFIIWAGFFIIVLPREIMMRDRSKEYNELQKHPDKYKLALRHMKDICTRGSFFDEYRRNSIGWWINELDSETREYIRKTPYYDHRRFKHIKEIDFRVAEKDKEHIAFVNKVGKKNMEAIQYAQKLASGEIGPAKRTMEAWWGHDISPEARSIIREMECYNDPHFGCIRSFDEKMKELKLLPEFKECR